MFKSVLRERIDDVAKAIIDARRCGHDYATHLYQARLEDLLDLAARNDLNTDGWVDPAVRGPAVRGDRPQPPHQ